MNSIKSSVLLVLNSIFVLIGFSYKFNLLVVCRCYRQNESIIRIISARKATKQERKEYLEHEERV